MITKLELEDWKSYERSELQLDPLTVIIGTNASGKSNALDALAFLNRIAGGALLTSALQGDGALSALRGGVEWAARRPGSLFALSAVCRADELTDYHYRLECRIADSRCEVAAEQLFRTRYRPGKDGRRRSAVGTIKLFRTDPCAESAPTIVARLYNEKQGTRRELGRTQPLLFQLVGQKLRQEIQDGIGEVVGSLREIFILDPIPSHMRGYSPLADKLDSDAKNIAGVIAALPAPKQQEIEEVLTRYASKLPERDIQRVYAETVGKFNSDAMLYSEENWIGHGAPPTVDARGMSDGTLRFLAILTALLTRPAGSLLVIEEVDNGLHPSRANMLLDVLKTVGAQRKVDVLATTHNPALLDAMGPSMVAFITVAHRDARTGNSELTLLEDIKQLPKLLAQGTLGRLSSKGLIEKSFQQAFDFAESVENSNG
ncbi:MULTISPECIES: AAA family ATPase [unclassified Variovorax]|uniref:AAA family ATPase n=1 Tax=unclassified Variovorax TaxID=663243 RepID=UPI001BD66722|nr:MULTISPECIES: ATP-binding protein [unclassified Variovorax]